VRLDVDAAHVPERRCRLGHTELGALDVDVDQVDAVE
jgi:hypothetical protein